MNKKRILIFASGRGSNAEAIHEAAINGTVNGEVIGVICDHADAQVLKRAERWNVPTTVIEMKACRDKADFNEKILEAAKSYNPDLICLAGYMRICGENLINAFENKIINIHPALLPSFRGLHAQRQAVEAGVKVSGCTVHFVGTGLDDGPIITQVAVPVYDDDTEDTLADRILQQEHPAYVRVVTAYCADELKIAGHHVSGMHTK
ncbi:phosphoribosylglycinamide formyltransferase [Dialister sp.]|uniref:phosphoribosylglycinamide formyltransferase n=1 Tax=Dialister sp. TaxID=1955814 RepID=UPI002E8058CD|nr:phosphoribosylglycinamide formyltransferase [Dialister sp.]MEE3453086.1 phosphoribosylglycinamide formyltransferase [Dialister sp.]